MALNEGENVMILVLLSGQVIGGLYLLVLVNGLGADIWSALMPSGLVNYFGKGATYTDHGGMAWGLNVYCFTV